jgi:cytochrome P450
MPAQDAFVSEAPPLVPLFSPEFREDPYPLYRAMRQGSRQVRFGPVELWFLSRYEDVLSALKRPEIFSSTAFREQQRPELRRSDVPQETLRELREVALVNVPTVINTDPPEHARYRGILNRGFTPREIGSIEPRVRAVAEQLVDELLARGGPTDLVRDFTVPVPVTIIAELLGVDPGRREAFKRWSDAFVSRGSRDSALEPIVARMREFNEYFAAEIERRRSHPSDDLISKLVHTETAEGRLSALEILAFSRLLLVAGNETTTNLVGNAVIALLEHPDQLERVRAEPDLIPNVVEETLRFDPPVQALPRLAMRDVELGGEKISAGATVMLMIGAANRDPARFPDPDRFDVLRDTTGHLGFGFGVHFCLGSHLARLESRCMLGAILGRMKNLRLAGKIERNSIPILRGPSTLPLDFDPA